MQQPPYYRVVPKVLYSAECVHCGRDLFEDDDVVAWTDADSIDEIIGNGDYWRCKCGAPLSAQEAELLAEPECDEQYRWLHRDPPLIGIGNMGGGHGA